MIDGNRVEAWERQTAYEHGKKVGAKEAIDQIRHEVLFTRTRLGTPPEKIRVTDLLAILDRAEEGHA